MPLTQAQIRADGALPFADFPRESATIDGTTYQALVMENRLGSEWMEGGEVLESSVTLALKRGEVASMPAEGDEATFRSATYRVGSVRGDDLSANVIVELRLPT